MASRDRSGTSARRQRRESEVAEDATSPGLGGSSSSRRRGVTEDDKLAKAERIELERATSEQQEAEAKAARRAARQAARAEAARAEAGEMDEEAERAARRAKRAAAREARAAAEEHGGDADEIPTRDSAASAVAAAAAAPSRRADKLDLLRDMEREDKAPSFKRALEEKRRQQEEEEAVAAAAAAAAAHAKRKKQQQREEEEMARLSSPRDRSSATVETHQTRRRSNAHSEADGLASLRAQRKVNGLDRDDDDESESADRVDALPSSSKYGRQDSGLTSTDSSGTVEEWDLIQTRQRISSIVSTQKALDIQGLNKIMNQVRSSARADTGRGMHASAIYHGILTFSMAFASPLYVSTDSCPVLPARRFQPVRSLERCQRGAGRLHSTGGAGHL